MKHSRSRRTMGQLLDVFAAFLLPTLAAALLISLAFWF
jgi:hypothetical protein